MDTITLNIPRLNVEGFKELCQVNKTLRLERASTGEVLIMPPTYPWTGRKNFGIAVRLGWLIDPKNKTVEIYRLGQDVEVLKSPTTLSGEDVLPGFDLNLNKV